MLCLAPCDAVWMQLYLELSVPFAATTES